MPKVSIFLALMITTLLSAQVSYAAPQPKSPFADKETEQDRWNLTDLYPSVEAWQQAKETLSKKIPSLAQYQGKLGSDAKTLATALDEFFALQKEFSRLAVYASLNSDQDTREAGPQSRRGAINLVGTEFASVSSFFRPEILAIGQKTLTQFSQSEKALAPYQHYLDDILREAKHTLSNEAEQIIAASNSLQQAPSDFYRTFTNAELPWPTVTLSNGESVRLDQAGYVTYREHQDRSIRKEVFDHFFSTLNDFKSTLATSLNGQVATNIFNAKVRNYDNALHSALAANNIPVGVYHTLVDQTNEHLTTLHRYLALRARMLSLQDQGYYDIYRAIVATEKTFPISQGKEIVLSATELLGDDYVKTVKKGFDERWMDVYPRPGKRSGAYMNGSAYDVHPYVLMNYNESFDSVSTLIHEWGHALHSHLSNTTQPYTTAGYPIFLAEIASVFNEFVLTEYMLNASEDDNEKLYYLGHALESIRTTFFRQTMFAEFELRIHQQVESGTPLTGDNLNELYGSLLKKYHGHDQGVMAIDDIYASEWAYIPHFYYNFYVYQYATSMAAAAYFADKVTQQQDGALEEYLALLQAGGSKYPYQLLTTLGLDMAEKAPYEAIFSRMNKLMDEVESILDK